MKVLICCGGYAPATAGAERMALHTAEALRRAGHTVALLVDNMGAVHQGSVPIMTAQPKGLPALGWRPDVVHAFDLAQPHAVAHAIDLARQWRVPFVMTPATTRSLWPDQELGREACDAAEALFALTETEAAALPVDPGKAHRIHLIPSAPSIDGTPNPAAVRATLPPGAAVVLFLGRRSRVKGYETLLDAAPLVWRTVPRALFLLIGPPWGDAGGAVANRRPDPRLADPRIVDLGVVDEQTKVDALAACDVLCLPSRAEAFPLVFVEAWTLGRPVISGDFPGVAEVARHGVDSLVTETTPEAVASAITTVLTDHDLRARLGDGARRRAARAMTWDAVAASLIGGYERCLRVGEEAR